MNNTIARTKKSFGPGSISILISIFSIMCSFTFTSAISISIGGMLLNKFHIYNMEHIVSIILAVFSLYISNKYKNNCGAKVGKGIAILLLVIMFGLPMLAFII